MQMRFSKTGASAALITGLALSASAQAITVSASDPFITVHASAGSFTGTITVPLIDVVTYSDPDADLWFWASTNPVPIFDGPNLVATLVNMTVLAGRNTQPDGEVRFGIDVDFGVQAGPNATTFELIAPTLSFDPILNASGLASAGIVGTDQNGNGITITPGFAGPFGFKADYNGGTNFRSYLSSTLSNLPSGSVSDSGNMSPEGVFQPIGTVNSISSSYKFTLSPGDTAGGTTQFSVAPTPGTAAMLGLGGLILGRRRR